MNQSIGIKIKRVRLNVGLSMEAFGKLFNPIASKGVVSNWETGKNLPNKERLKKIAEYNNQTVDDFLCVDDKIIDEQIENMTIRQLKHFARLYIEENGGEGGMSFDWFNSEHYKDETAKVALDNVEKQETKRKQVDLNVKKEVRNREQSGITEKVIPH